MSGCCCVEVENGPSCITEEVRTARKEYKCGECPDTIKKGDKYEYVRGKWDGCFGTYRTCITCLSVRRDFFSCGWYYGRIREMFEECYGWDYYIGPDPYDMAEDTDPLFTEEAK